MPRNALAACAARAVLLLPLHSFALSSLKKSDPYTTKKLPVFFRFDPQILRKTLSASSAESVGEFWLGEVAELMI